MGKCWLLRGSLTSGGQNEKKKKIGFRNSSAPIVDKQGSSAPGAASRLAAAKPYRQILGADIFYKKKKDLRRVKVAKAWENFSRSQFFFFKFSASGRETLLKFGMLAVIFDVICCD